MCVKSIFRASSIFRAGKQMHVLPIVTRGQSAGKRAVILQLLCKMSNVAHSFGKKLL